MPLNTVTGFPIDMKISAIDIGSNSVRLAMFADGKTLYKRLATTRLGGGISLTGMLSEEAIERTAQAVCAFVCDAKTEGAEKIYAFATAAVRSAENGGAFVRRVKELCGTEVEVLSGEIEAKTGILGALRGRDGGIIDVGGASTEVNIRCCGRAVFTKSVDIGTVRLNDLAERDRRKLDAVIGEKLEDYGTFDASADFMAAIGGTATTIASVKHGLKVYDPKITDGTVISVHEVLAMAEKILAMSVEEVRAMSGMEPRRADVIGGGCLLLGRVMEHFNIKEITVSESDNLEGYVLWKEGKL